MRIRESDPSNYDPKHSYAAKQLSRYDMQVAGVVVFLIAMTVLFVVALVMMLFRNEPMAQARTQGVKPAITASATSPANQFARAEIPKAFFHR